MRLNFFLIKKNGKPLLLIKRYYDEPTQKEPVKQFSVDTSDNSHILKMAHKIQERVQRELG